MLQTVRIGRTKKAISTSGVVKGTQYFFNGNKFIRRRPHTGDKLFLCNECDKQLSRELKMKCRYTGNITTMPTKGYFIPAQWWIGTFFIGSLNTFTNKESLLTNVMCKQNLHH